MLTHAAWPAEEYAIMKPLENFVARIPQILYGTGRTNVWYAGSPFLELPQEQILAPPNVDMN
jgi:hypothetical protein